MTRQQPERRQQREPDQQRGNDFIQEVKPDIEFSADTGAIGRADHVVTKRGTNEYHGSAFEFLRNDKFDARSFFPRAANPAL